MGGFCPLVELHWEGSAPAACAAGLFGYQAVTRGENKQVGKIEKVAKIIKVCKVA